MFYLFVFVLSVRAGLNNGAFYNCSKLKSVSFGNNSKLTSIGDSAFCGCDGLTGELKIPDSVTSIGNSAFSDCSRLTGELKIPDSVTSIGNQAFRGCSRLTSVTIPNSVTSIGYWAFINCSGLTFVTIGRGVTSIGDGEFEGCSGLEKVYFENPNGWKVSKNSDTSSPTDVSGLDDPETAARYLKSTYYKYDWERYN